MILGIVMATVCWAFADIYSRHLASADGTWTACGIYAFFVFAGFVTGLPHESLDMDGLTAWLFFSMASTIVISSIVDAIIRRFRPAN